MARSSLCFAGCDQNYGFLAFWFHPFIEHAHVQSLSVLFCWSGMLALRLRCWLCTVLKGCENFTGKPQAPHSRAAGSTRNSSGCQHCICLLGVSREYGNMGSGKAGNINSLPLPTHAPTSDPLVACGIQGRRIQCC